MGAEPEKASPPPVISPSSNTDHCCCSHWPEMQALGTEVMPLKPNAILINGMVCLPFHTPLGRMKQASLPMMTIMRFRLSLLPSLPCFPLAVCPRALPLNLSRFFHVDMLQPLCEGCFVQGWVKAVSLANPRDWLCGCSVCSLGRWGWAPFSVFLNEAALLREWSVWLAEA